MTLPHQDTVSGLLGDLRSGDREAFDKLFPLVYAELHRLAERQRQRWHGDDTLNTTGLVHEAYLRLVDQSTPAWQSRPHFLAVASRAMRQILLDYAKRRQRLKRGGGRQQVALHEIEDILKGDTDPSDVVADALVALDASLLRLEQRNARQSRIVECRFFAGMGIEDTAEALGISPATVKRGWAMAQAWLHRDVGRALESSP